MKTLYLVRHAHRDVTDRSLDNGLSAKGRHQADEIAEWFIALKLPHSLRLFTSPKLRCRETLAPLAKAMTGRPGIIPALDEQHEDEAPTAFLERVRAWLEAWVASKDLAAIACSHGDWIPLAIALATGERVELSKGGIARLTFDSPSPQASSLQITQKPRTSD